MVSSESESVRVETANEPMLETESKSSWLVYPFNLWNRMILKIAGRTGGTKAKEVERFLKFATVGVIGAIIDFGVLNLLQATVLSPTESHVAAKVALATGTAFVSAVSSNFVWNRYWTYPDSRTRPIQQQWFQFFLVSLAGLAFRLIWVRTLFGPLGSFGADGLQTLGLTEELGEIATKKLGTNFAQFFAVWIVMVWNFFVNRYWTYNDVE
jgi:putative flippase GtrA